MMQDNAKRELEKFRERIEPFKCFWQSIIVRAAWAQIEEQPRILTLSVVLDQRPIGQLTKPTESAETANFHIAWEAFGMSHIDQLLNRLSEGFVEVEEKRILVGSYTNKQWGEWNYLHINFHRPGEFAPNDMRMPSIDLSYAQSMNCPLYEEFKDSNLSEQFRVLDAPFENKEDVLQNHLGIDSARRGHDEIYLSVQAEIPLTFVAEMNPNPNRLCLRATMPQTANPEKVSIGLIEVCQDNRRRRLKIDLKSSAWSKVSEVLELRHELPLGDDVVRAILFLRYGGIFLAQRTVLPVASSNRNVALDVHALLDQNNCELMRCLTGHGKDKGGDFEMAVAWLFGFCGFVTHSYGRFPLFQEDGVDVAAYSQETRLIFAVECATAHPETLGKMPRLVARYRRMLEVAKRAGFSVIPVMAFALEEDEVARSEREAAKADGIALLSQKQLQQLFKMASEGKQSRDVAEYIVASIERKREGYIAAQLGLEQH